MRRIKKLGPELISRITALEIVDLLSQIVGATAINQVVSIPPGHSSLPGFSTMIGIEVAQIIDKQYVQVFDQIATRSQSSHPKNNVTRGILKQIQPVSGPVLLVDDIATSGSHIEEASKLLRPQAEFIFSIAWIGQ